MKRWLGSLLAATFLIFAPAAQAANSSVPAMTAATSVAGGDLFYCAQSAGTLDRKCTGTQMAAFIYGLMSGDATASGTGAVTFATVNANVGSFGSATSCPSVTVNAKGLVTAASAATCTPAVGSITGTGTGVITALGVNVGTAGSFVVNGGALGTPSGGTLTNTTGFPLANLSGAGTGVLTLLANASSGTGAPLGGTAPTMSSPTINTAMTLGFLTGAGTECMQVSNTGVVSGTGSACGAGGGGVTSIASNTGAFTLNATSGITNATNDIKCQVGSATQFGCLKVDGTTITASAGVITATTSGGTVTSVAAGCGTSTGGSAITTTGTVSAAITRRLNSTTSDTIVAADCGNLVAESNSGSIAVAIAQAGTTGFAAGTYFEVCNIAAGTATITPTTSTIGGASTYALPGASAAAPKCTGIQSDGTNYNVVPDWFTVGALATITPGTGVATAATANLSAAGGLTSTIASGTAALGTGAITNGTCATAVTVAATNVATTDIVTAGFAADPTATTGYLPTAMLTIVPYPTSGNVNFKVCNLTGSSITPSAVTINWRVTR